MRLRRIVVCGLLITMSAALAGGLATVASSANGPPTSTLPVTTTSTPTTTTTPTTAPTSTPTTTAAHSSDNPFTNPTLGAFLRGRKNVVTAAVYDVKSGATFTYHNGIREVTASLVKIDILADLLYEDQVRDANLTPRQQTLATSMIEDSNDAAATKLWAVIGGRDAIDDFNTMIGFANTVPSWSWGEIETTPLDQLQLLKVIALPNRFLDGASREYLIDLMEGVIASERFGLGWGSPAGATVGLKNGYYFEKKTQWQLNSSGFVRYQGRFYLVTIMTSNNATEEYGIETLTTIASDVWKYLKP